MAFVFVKNKNFTNRSKKLNAESFRLLSQSFGKMIRWFRLLSSIARVSA
jgi:hypothetical protein